MAHTGTPWSAEEDKLLIQAVSIHGEVDQWKAIAFFIPGRTNKACRKVSSTFKLDMTHL
jgi:hypothetical protein